MGVVERVVVSAEFSNNGENSFNPYLTFQLSKQYFQQPRITPLSVRKTERGRIGTCLIANDIILYLLNYRSSSLHAMIRLQAIVPMDTTNAKI